MSPALRIGALAAALASAAVGAAAQPRPAAQSGTASKVSSPASPSPRDTAPATPVSWERIAWAIEQGLQPVEIDRLRRYRCIPGRLMPATYSRLFNALALWRLGDDDRVARIDSWRCDGGVSASRRPSASGRAAAGAAKGAGGRGQPVKPKAGGTAAKKAPPSRAGQAGASSKAAPRTTARPPATSSATRSLASSASSTRGTGGVRGAAGSPPSAGIPSQSPAPIARPDTTVSLSVLSTVGSLPVTVNRVAVGRTPVALPVPKARLVAIAVGEGRQRRDTTVYITGRHDVVVTVDRGRPEAVQGGAPLPTAAALTRASVESELAAVLPPLPPEPVLPTRRSVRGARTDLYWSLAVTGVASLASSAHCRRQATAPEPYGGTYTGTYHPAGTFVPSAFLLCSSAIGVTAGAASFPLFRIFSRFANDGVRRRYQVDSASFPQRRDAYRQLRQLRTASVDSALAMRRVETGAAPALRWRVDTVPRRRP